jgi:transcriptional regulator with XRE-family HTH domain
MSATAGRGRPAPSGFGLALKDWRARRRFSQLELALAAGVSARHVAFLETGRARPSREMVVALAAAMDVPLGRRNELMHAAGFAPLYRARPLDDQVLKPVRRALDLMLARHEPFPAILIDRHWSLIEANRSAMSLLGPLLGAGVDGNIVHRLLGNPEVPRLVANWPEVLRDLLARIRLELAHAGGDAELEALTALISADPALAGPLAARDPGADPFVRLRLRVPSGEIALLSTIAEFGTVEDVTVRDLRLELFFPADAVSEEVLRERAG